MRLHKFLRAIGFSNLNKKELDNIIADIMEHPTVLKVAEDSEGNEFAEMSKEYGEFMGISLRGTYREDDRFEVDYYYPYFQQGKKLRLRNMQKRNLMPGYVMK